MARSRRSGNRGGANGGAAKNQAGGGAKNGGAKNGKNGKNGRGNGSGGNGGGGNGAAKAAAVRDFWGAHLPVPEPVASVRPADNPAAVVRSLGSPPLTGHETIAEHYFAAVYEKAAKSASALAAASGLLDYDTGSSD